MSGGLSFGALPSFADLTPDMQAHVMAALQGQDPQQPKGLGGLLGQMDPQGGPPVAMSEADTRRMERAMASPADAAALDRPPSLHDLLFSGSAMGGPPNSFQPVRGPGQVGAPGDPGFGPIDQRVPAFSGAGAGANQPDPQATGSVGAGGSRLVPLPPQRPSEFSAVPFGLNPGGASGAAPGMPSAPAPQGATNPPAATGPALAPNVGQFDPLTGQVVSGSPQRPGAPPAAVSPSGAAQATGQAEGTGGGSLLERFANRLNNPDVSNLLLNVGMGLMSQRGFGPGITAGLQGYQNSQLNNVKQQLQQFQLMQQVQGQNATRALLKTKGYTPEQIEAGVYNPTLLTNMLAQEKPNYQTVGGQIYDLSKGGGVPGQGNLIGPASGPPDGFERDPNNPGALRPVAGGPQSLDYKRAVAPDRVHFDRDPVTGELTAYRTDQLFPDSDGGAGTGGGTAGGRGAAAGPAGGSDANGVARTLIPGNRAVRIYGQQDPRTGEVVQPPPNSPPGVSGYYDASGKPVTLDRSPETERDKAVGGAIGKDIAGYIDAGKPAREKMAALNILDDAWKAGKDKITTGPSADRVLSLKQFARGSLGLNIGDDIAPSELISKIGTQLATADAKSLTARPTQFDFGTYLKNNPGLALTPEGNAALIGIKKQQAQHEIDLAALARDRNNWDRWDEVTAAYDKAHPIISPLTKRPLGADEVNFPDPNGQRGDPAARYQQLMRGGMSKSDAFAQMHREGL